VSLHVRNISSNPKFDLYERKMELGLGKIIQGMEMRDERRIGKEFKDPGLILLFCILPARMNMNPGIGKTVYKNPGIPLLSILSLVPAGP